MSHYYHTFFKLFNNIFLPFSYVRVTLSYFFLCLIIILKQPIRYYSVALWILIPLPLLFCFGVVCLVVYLLSRINTVKPVSFVML